MIDNKKIVEIKNSHKQSITNFRHCLDNYNKRDLIISISGEDNNLKLWNVNNYDCLLNIENESNKLRLYSACFLNDNNQIYIVTGNLNNEPIEIFDLNGKIVKKINNFNDSVLFIDTYYDIKNSKIYILTCNKKCVKSYDYTNNKEYHTYNDLNKEYINSFFEESHRFLIINNKEELIESCNDGKIRIWNFHSSILIKIIRVTKEPYELEFFCLWDNEYLFAGCYKTIKIVELKTGKIINILNGHNKTILYLTTFNLPKYGKSLISQGLDNDGIKLWINK